jgi:ubiquinone/menaquinone biosynthesis C-methylase UbiE
MALYRRFVLPRLIDIACGGDDTARQRQRIVPRARGRVLEVGMGPGLNLPWYDRDRVEVVWGLEPNDAMRTLAADRIEASGLDVRWLDQPGESIPLDDASVDTVVLTFTLCSVDDPHLALREMRRVLRSDGTLLFCEHGRAPDASVRQWQHRVEPVWKRVAGGCHLGRSIPQLVEHAGFRIDELDQGYQPGPRISGYQYWGSAHPS